MADASNVQTDFRGGEFSPYAQGRLDDPEYKRGMNVCRNGIPLEAGAWVRRPGTRDLSMTRNGARGKMVAFNFSEAAPYTMEFTDGFIRFRNGLGLVLSEEPRSVVNINGATPAVLTTTTACSGLTNWNANDTVIFNFLTGKTSAASGYLVNGQFVLKAGASQEQWLLYDAETGQAVDGALLQWDQTLEVQVGRIFELTTPYLNGSWAALRGVQDEDSVLLLHPTIQPYTIFAPIDGGNLFTINPANFIDGPYLAPPTDGSYLTSSALTGTVNITINYPAWSNTQSYPDGTYFFATTQKRAGQSSTSGQYTAGAVVSYSGTDYVSIQNNNVNHTPTDTAWWQPIAAGAIVGPEGFTDGDIGRLIRLNSEPDLWESGTSYTSGQLVTYQNAYYVALQNNTGETPGADAVNWGVATNASGWTWGIITAIVSQTEVTVAIQGQDLLYANNIRTWRLGTYANSTSWPTCGTFHEGRFWLGGAVKNAFDASKSDGNTYDFTPTAPDGTVSDDNAISETLASAQQEMIQNMLPGNGGIMIYTVAGEWLLQSSANNDPITPTSIQVHNVTKWGSANVEPRRTGQTIAFVQRYGKMVMEYLSDLFSGKPAAKNLTERGKHLTKAGIIRLAYQQELVPSIWALCADNTLIGTTYKRESLMVTQPPEMNGWHRHDLGSGNNIIDLVEGPSPDGLTDTITLMTQNPTTGVCRVEAMAPIYDEDSEIQDAWFVDGGIVPSGAEITSVNGVQGVLLSGLRHLNGQSVAAFIAGLDCGNYTPVAGQIFVPFQSDPDKQFTAAYFQSINADSYDFGIAAVYTNPNANIQTMMQFPPISNTYLSHFTYLNYGAQAIADWKRDRVTFLLPGFGPYAGFIQYKISTGAFIQYVKIDGVFGGTIPQYYDNTKAYAATPLVLGSDLKIYAAAVGGSLGVDPTISGQKDWTLMYPTSAYNAGTSYALNAYVSYMNNLYVSLTGSNLGNTPNVSPSDWALLYPLPAVWSGSTVYGSPTFVMGDDDEIFWTVSNVPAGQGDPNSFSRNANPYWGTLGQVWGPEITTSGISLDFNGDLFMYQSSYGGTGTYLRVNGNTLQVSGFATAGVGQGVPTPSNYSVPLGINDNNGNLTASFILETVDTTPFDTNEPSAVLMATDGLFVTESATFVFDEGVHPIACSGMVGVGYGQAYVITRTPSSGALTAAIGLYEINAYKQDTATRAKLTLPEFWVDPNLSPIGLYQSFPYGQLLRKCGTIAPSAIDPLWTFHSAQSGLMFDPNDGRIMCFFSTQNPNLWTNVTSYAQDDSIFSYALGSDNNVYRAKQSGTAPNPVSDGGVHWTLIGPKAQQLCYLVKLTTDCANVAWLVPVASPPTTDIGCPYINLEAGYYTFLEDLGLGVYQVRKVNTLTGEATVQFPTQAGVTQQGFAQVYNSVTGDIILYPVYDSTQTGPTAAPTPVNPAGGTTPSTFTGWGKYNVQPSSFSYNIPAVVGFTFTSQGQLLRPVAPAETGARNGPAFGKSKRYHRYAISVANTSPSLQIGTDFDAVGVNAMRPCRFKSRSGKGALLTSTAALYTGEHSDTIDCEYNLDGMLCWQITRPVPAAMLAVGGMLSTQDR